MENKIGKVTNDFDRLSPEQQERELQKLNEELNDRLNKLKNETEPKTIKKLVSCGDLCNHCNYCENNCHHYCNCFFSSFGNCSKITWGGKCIECGHSKSNHRQDYYHYIYDTIYVQKNTDNQQKEEKDRMDKTEGNFTKHKASGVHTRNLANGQVQKITY